MKSRQKIWLVFAGVLTLEAIALLGCRQDTDQSAADSSAVMQEEPDAEASKEGSALSQEESAAVDVSSAPASAYAEVSEKKNASDNPQAKRDQMVWWQFDEGKGEEISDSTKNPKYRGILCGEGTWSSGKVGPSALNFDGETVHVALQTPGLLDIGDQITLAAWIKSEKKKGYCNIIVQQDLTPKANSEIILRVTGGKYQVGVWHGSGRDNFVSLKIPKEDAGTWVHLAGVCDGKHWSLYRNGKLAAQRKIDAEKQQPLKFPGPWTIGGTRRIGNGRYFKGQIDEVWLYNRAITAEEVQEIAGVPPPSAPPEATSPSAKVMPDDSVDNKK